MERVRRHSEYQFDLSGGALCLDFANTVSRRHLPKLRAEHLTNFSDLIAFAEQSKLLSPKLAAALRSQANPNLPEAANAFRKAILLREGLYRAFSAIAHKKPVRPDDLQQINDSALEALQHRQLTGVRSGYRWEWQSDGTDLDRVLWPIAQSAADLLTSNDREDIRECGAPDCEWLFLDHSRNGRRRWCDMKSCGNRQKARRHYQRVHE